MLSFDTSGLCVERSEVGDVGLPRQQLVSTLMDADFRTACLPSTMAEARRLSRRVYDLSELVGDDDVKAAVEAVASVEAEFVDVAAVLRRNQAADPGLAEQSVSLTPLVCDCSERVDELQPADAEEPSSPSQATRLRLLALGCYP